MRPSWDEIWMSLAESLAARSTCSRAQVGCVVVSRDNTRVLGIGYNGGAEGVFNDCLSDEPGKCGHLHAEDNALLKTDYTDRPAKMYVTTQPCRDCAVRIINAHIDEVIYRTPYRLTDGLEMLSKRRIPVRQFQPPTPGLPAWPTIEPENAPPMRGGRSAERDV